MLSRFIFYFVLISFTIIATGAKAFAKNYQLKTVVIDAGHGGKDPGTVFGKTQEKNIALKVALKTGELIKKNYPETNVIFTRKNDTFVNLDERANIANRNKADLFISIHVNYCERSSANGAETYVMGLHTSKENLEVAKLENSVILLEDDYTERYEGFDPQQSESYIMFELLQNAFLEQSRQLADKVQKHIKTEASRYNRGVKQAGFLVLRRTSMPSVLIELGYISNQHDRQFMESEEGITQLATSIANAFIEYKKTLETKSNPSSAAKIDTPTIAAEQPPVQQTIEEAADSFEIKNLNGIWFAVQVLTSPTALAPGNAKFMGYTNFYHLFENGSHKYFLNVNQDYNESKKGYNELKNTFTGAFPVAFKDGTKVKLQDAVKESQH